MNHYEWAEKNRLYSIHEYQRGGTIRSLAGPAGSFVSTGACNPEIPGSNPGRAGYLSSWLCIYSAPKSSNA